MLHASPESLLFLRQQMGRARAEERKRRSIGVRPPTRRLHHKTFNRLVENVALVLKTGYPTKFEYEAACRHGVRVSLIAQGWSWHNADHAAIEVVLSALTLVGAKRPTWDEGQVDYAVDHRVDRDRCARCHGPIDDERRYRGRSVKYCSVVCSRSAYEAKASASGERVAMADHLARLALKSEKTIRERSGECERCGTPFLTRSMDRKFCSSRCSSEAQATIKPTPCEQCGTTFKPRAREGGGVSKFCSNTCRGLASKRPLEPRACKHCETVFTPGHHNKKQAFCSHGCATAAKKKHRPESSCQTCRSVFRWKVAAVPQVYCSQPCNPRSPSYVGRSAFKCEEVG